MNFKDWLRGEGLIVPTSDRNLTAAARKSGFFVYMRLKIILISLSLMWASFPAEAAITIKDIPNKKPADLVNLAYYKFRTSPGFYDSYSSRTWQDHITFHYRFQNMTDETVTGILFHLLIKDGAGNEVYSKEISLGVQISGRGKSSQEEYFYWENDPFNDADAYDRILPCAEAEDCIAEATIKGVSFQKGLTIKSE